MDIFSNHLYLEVSLHVTASLFISLPVIFHGFCLQVKNSNHCQKDTFFGV